MYVFSDTPVARVVGYGDLFFVHWKQKASVAEYGAVIEQQARMRTRLGSKPMASLSIVGSESVVKPSAELQKAIDEHTRQSRGWLKADALVINADGFAASLMRSVITGVALFARAEHPYKVFQQVDGACGWIAPYVVAPDDQPASASAIRRLVGL